MCVLRRRVTFVSRAWTGEAVPDGDLPGERRPVGPPGPSAPGLMAATATGAVSRTVPYGAGRSGGPARPSRWRAAAPGRLAAGRAGAPGCPARPNGLTAPAPAPRFAAIRARCHSPEPDEPCSSTATGLARRGPPDRSSSPVRGRTCQLGSRPWARLPRRVPAKGGVSGRPRPGSRAGDRPLAGHRRRSPTGCARAGADRRRRTGARAVLRRAATGGAVGRGARRSVRRHPGTTLDWRFACRATSRPSPS